MSFHRAVHFSLQLFLLPCCICIASCAVSLFQKDDIYWEKTKETRKLHFLGALSSCLVTTKCPTKGSEHKYSYVELLGGPLATNTAWLWSLEASVLTHEGG